MLQKKYHLFFCLICLFVLPLNVSADIRAHLDPVEAESTEGGMCEIENQSCSGGECVEYETLTSEEIKAVETLAATAGDCTYYWSPTCKPSKFKKAKAEAKGCTAVDCSKPANAAKCNHFAGNTYPTITKEGTDSDGHRTITTLTLGEVDVFLQAP